MDDYKADRELIYAYRTYLRGELGKLCELAVAEDLIRAAASQLAELGLPTRAVDLAPLFTGQAHVDDQVDGLSDQAAIVLVQACANWRTNNVADYLMRCTRESRVLVPIQSVYLRQAEPDAMYKHLFERNAYYLPRVASDPDLLALPPYSDHRPGDEVACQELLATPNDPTGSFKILDGMHRAIQLFRNGETKIRLVTVT